jgi:AbrB family looped-hinge helix DNA binding protein
MVDVASQTASRSAKATPHASFLDASRSLNHSFSVTTTITGKNQVTLPAELVRELGWQPGTQLDWTKTEDGKLIATRKLTRGELARQMMGRGRKWLKPGDDPIKELIEERMRDEDEIEAKWKA